LFLLAVAAVAVVAVVVVAAVVVVVVENTLFHNQVLLEYSNFQCNNKMEKQI